MNKNPIEYSNDMTAQTPDDMESFAAMAARGREELRVAKSAGASIVV